MLSFPADRYQRAGATADRIIELQGTFNAMPDLGKLSLVQHVASISDYDLRQELEASAAAETINRVSIVTAVAGSPDPNIGTAADDGDADDQEPAAGA